ncbi:(3S,6E)-nerolidol synthase 1-like protein [Tanacetum coccineum]
MHSHSNTRQPSNVRLPLTPSIRDPRNTRRITNSDKLIHSYGSLTPYESFCKHINIITSEEDEDTRHAELIKRVRSLMTKVTDDSFEDLIMVDALQRLAIDYHFEDEINIILRKRYNQFNNSDLFEHRNLFEISLCFRILRQNGFYVSADAFKRFKGDCKNFDEKWRNDIIGLMALYEASQFSTEGETILDEAANFSYHLLHDMVEMHNDALTGMVRHALNSPFQKTLPLFGIKNSAKFYNGTVLQELAKMDFNKLQSIHHTELHQGELNPQRDGGYHCE